MARWQITEPQYLNSPGTFWEQVINDRVTQRPIRKQYPVPLFLDPRLQTDWNYDPEGTGRPRKDDMDGMIIVAYAGKGKPNDIIFEGPPNPGMLPLDDEAREVSSKYNWTPTPDLSDEASRASHQAKILDNLFQRLADATVQGPNPIPAGFDKFMESMAAMIQQQTMILMQLVNKTQGGEFERQAKEIGAEPAVDDEPLGDADEPTAEEIAESARIAAESARIANERAKADLARTSRRV